MISKHKKRNRLNLNVAKQLQQSFYVTRMHLCRSVEDLSDHLNECL